LALQIIADRFTAHRNDFAVAGRSVAASGGLSSRRARSFCRSSAKLRARSIGWVRRPNILEL
jgi:hypothetical protein